MNRSSLVFSLIFAAAVATSAVQSGCVAVVAAGAGAGAVAYVRGELQGTFTGSLESSERATNLALAQLQLVKINEKRDAFVSIITARTAEDKKVEIKLTKLANETTKAQIRVGVFGDEAKSLAILDKIKANL